MVEQPAVNRSVIGSNPICAANNPWSSSGRTSDFESENVWFESHPGKIKASWSNGLGRWAFNPETGGSNPLDACMGLMGIDAPHMVQCGRGFNSRQSPQVQSCGRSLMAENYGL